MLYVHAGHLRLHLVFHADPYTHLHTVHIIIHFDCVLSVHVPPPLTRGPPTRLVCSIQLCAR